MPGCHNANNFLRSFDGESFATQKSAHMEHYNTALGNFRGHPFALGSSTPRSKTIETFQDAKWNVLEPFPFVENYIFDYSFVTIDDALLLFGGWGDDRQQSIAAKFNGEWSRIGDLMEKRDGHRSLANSQFIYHIGGDDW